MALSTDTKSKGRAQGTAHGRVYAGLKSALMNGDLLPGQRLVVRQLAERFETSAMPVREALRQLVSEAALVDHPNRGVIVPDATVEVIADLVRVRCSIEGAATEWAAQTISPGELETIIRLNEGMKRCASEGDAEDYLAFNREFHFAIYKASRSLVLQPIIERLWLRAGPWLNIMRDEATLGLGLDHHLEVIEALQKGEGARARRALMADITDAGDIMLRAASAPAGVSPNAGRRQERPSRSRAPAARRGGGKA